MYQKTANMSALCQKADKKQQSGKMPTTIKADFSLIS